jgi:hypothetical protein
MMVIIGRLAGFDWNDLLPRGRKCSIFNVSMLNVQVGYFRVAWNSVMFMQSKQLAIRPVLRQGMPCLKKTR